MADRMVASLRISRIRERMGHEPAKSTLVDDNMHVLDEIGRGRPAVSFESVQLTRLNHVDDRLEIGRPEAVYALRIHDGSIGEDLQEHSELAAVVGAAQGESRQRRDPRW